MSRHALDRCDHLIGFALEHPWALTADMCETVAGILARRIAGLPTSAEDVAAAVVRRKNDEPTARQGVCIIPIYGVIAPRMNLLSEMSGGTSFDKLTGQLREALAFNPKAIILDIDSPGGNVAGATEFARAVLKARTEVPIIAQSHHLMASAAYWVGACATEIAASPSSMVGSVGVFTLYNDISAQLEMFGVKREVIAAGEFKGEGVDGGPLSDSARAHRKAIVNQCLDRFVHDVALGRGVTAEVVRTTYGKGRLLPVDDALAAGMITRVATLDETIERFAPAAAGLAPVRELAAASAQEPLTAATAQERAARIARDHELQRQIYVM